jgi:hypothetical protein
MTNNWTVIHEGNVTLINHSAAAIVEIQLGEPKDRQTLWLHYSEFADLKEALIKTNDPPR